MNEKTIKVMFEHSTSNTPHTLDKKKNTVYINVPHSRFLPFLFISSSLLSAAP